MPDFRNGLTLAVPKPPPPQARTSVSLPHPLAAAATVWAKALKIDRAVYLRILLRNAQVRPPSGPVPPVSPAEHKYATTPVHVAIPKRERAQLHRQIHPVSLSAHTAALVRADLTAADPQLVILAHGPKPELR